MWLMLQQDQPDDYVIATGQQHSVREFVQRTAADLGITLRFEGEGTDEIGVVEAVSGDEVRCCSGDVIVRVDPRYFRPAEVETLLGDATKARERLGWQPATSFDELVREMTQVDLREARREHIVAQAGTRPVRSHQGAA
jgi:GDPmannose 4,6-dehydratase